jgi:type I restriction enzyme S subunit
MKWKAYSKYKDSGFKWLGSVPVCWAYKRLKYCANMINEKSDGTRSDLTFTGLEHIESWKGRILPSEERVTSEGQPNVFRSGDVLFGKLRPYLAKVLRATSEGMCTGELLVLRPGCITQGYLFYYLLARDFINIVDSSTYGAKMPRANWEFIGNLPMLLPSITEQRAITAFLDRETERIDTLIAKKKRQIELLQEKRAALISHAVTKGLNPNVKMKDSSFEWMGEICAHWEVVSLRRIAALTRLAGYEYTTYWEEGQEGEIIALCGHNIGCGTLDIGDVSKISDKLSRRLIRSRLFEGDVVFPCVGSIGNAAVIAENNRFHINQNIAKLTPNYQINPYYLMYWLMCEKTEFQIFYYNTSYVQPSVLVNNLRKFLVPLPPKIEQEAIVAFVRDKTGRIDSLISVIEESVTKLQEYRTALISAAVTGKIDVRKEVG